MTGRPGTVDGPDPPGRPPLLPTILLVDADEDAGAMVRDALLEGSGPCELRTVPGPDELDAYLSSAASPEPTLVLVDLDLPDDEAARAIARLKRDPERKRVPVVALTRLRDEAAIARAYDAGANTVLPRPLTFLALVRLMKVFTAYWLEAAALPRIPT
jgi:CheY-like chemotaxis protein